MKNFAVMFCWDLEEVFGRFLTLSLSARIFEFTYTFCCCVICFSPEPDKNSLIYMELQPAW